MRKIRLTSLDKDRPVDLLGLKRFALFLFGNIFKEKNCRIDIVFMDDRTIRGLNRRFKKSDRPTDVLCFRYDLEPAGCADKETVFGDIFISLQTAEKNARFFRNEVCMEKALYVAHGMLHMAGYMDGTPKERAEMARQEKIYVKCYRPAGRDRRCK